MRKLDRYDIYDVFGYTYIMVINEFDDDYVSYSKAMASSKANIWYKAMDAKIQSMYSNGVWALMDPPEWIISIRYKWVYKKKISQNENVETFKTKLVAKGYT